MKFNFINKCPRGMTCSRMIVRNEFDIIDNESNFFQASANIDVYKLRVNDLRFKGFYSFLLYILNLNRFG